VAVGLGTRAGPPLRRISKLIPTLCVTRQHPVWLGILSAGRLRGPCRHGENGPRWTIVSFEDAFL